MTTSVEFCEMYTIDGIIGHTLNGRYKIQSLLSSSVRCRTFLATDIKTQTSVVLKLLLFGLDLIWADFKLFEREAITLQSLNHDALPKYLDYFELESPIGNGFGLVQSYIEARSLQDWVKSGRTFSEQDLQGIARNLLNILNYIHTRQPPIIHRDIKPSNILLSDRSGHSLGKLYLVDFGSVRTTTIEGTMTIVGTYGYMPPEQFLGKATPASDLYSLSATLIYLATGQHPKNLTEDMLIDFENLVTLSPSFQNWLRWLTFPELSKRPISAQAAIQKFQDAPVKVLPLQHISLVTRRPCSTSLELKKTSETLSLRVPETQLNQRNFTHTKFRFTPASIFLGALIVIIGYFALVSGIIWLLVVFYLIKVSFFQKSLIVVQVNSILIEKEKNLIFIGLLSNQAQASSLETPSYVFRKQLKDISAGPCLPHYQINFKCFEASGEFNIIGNRAEMQWLCDEIIDWGGLEIEYKDSSVTM